MAVTLIGHLTARVLPERTRPVQAIIVHTTGDRDLDKILRWYGSPDGLQPHYVIAVDGAIYRIAWEDRVAWHSKIDPLEARLYQRGYQEWSRWHWPLGADAPRCLGEDEFAGYRSWRARWRDGRGYQSPLELVTGDHPNSVSVGIELQATDKSGVFADAQYDRLAALCVDIAGRQQLQLDADHVLAHQDVSPMRRSTSAGGWDPGELFQWNRLWDLVRTASPMT
jgi:N-acetyl-anhydromuramyl-L-alanine amidase AmpD